MKVKIPTGKVDNQLTLKIQKIINVQKRVEDDNPDTNIDGIDYKSMKKISEFIKKKVSANRDILTLFPDVELAMVIMVSSLIAPADLRDTNLIFNFKKNSLPMEVVNLMMNLVKNTINEEYELEDRIYKIMSDTLFLKGSYAEISLSKDLLLDMLSLKNEKVITEELISDLGNKTNIFENYNQDDLIISLEDGDKVYKPSNDLGLMFTDNPSILKLEEVKLDNLEKELESTLSLESLKNNNIHMKLTEIKDGVLNLKDEFKTKIKERSTLISIEPEAIIVLHSVGNVSNHVGYFILLDENGTPLKNLDVEDEVKFYNNLETDEQTILKNSRENLKGLIKKAPSLKGKLKIVEKIFKHEINEKVKNSKLNKLVKVKINEEVYRVATYRALTNLNTRVLFVPASLMSYYAFDFRDDGSGKSLLEKITLPASLRGIALFTKLNAMVLAGMPTTVVRAKLDDADPNQEKTRETIIDMYLKKRQMRAPVGTSSVQELTDWAHSAKYAFDIKGRGLPDIELETENVTTEVPDTENGLEAESKKNMLMGIGIPPEMVDNGFNSEFAATVLTNNALFSKQITELQKRANKLITTNVKNILKNDGIFQHELSLIIDNNYKQILRTINKSSVEKIDTDKHKEKDIKEWIRLSLMDDLFVSLPKPRSFDKVNKKESFEEFKSSVEEYVESYLSSDALPPDITGEMSDTMDSYKTAILHTAIRKWMIDNDYLPEIHNIFNYNENGEPTINLLEDWQTYLDTVGKSIKGFYKKNRKSIDKWNKINKDKGNEQSVTGTDGSGNQEETGNEFGNTGDVNPFDENTLGEGDNPDKTSGSETKDTDDTKEEKPKEDKGDDKPDNPFLV